MAEDMRHLGDGGLLALIDAALDALFDDRVRLPSEREQLALLQDSLRVQARLRAWQARLAASVELTGAAWHEHGTSTSTWLTDVARLTRREAARLIAAGEGLVRFSVVGEAAAAGRVLPAQADAITGVLDGLSDDIPSGMVEDAQEVMVELAGSHNATELGRLSRRLLEVLDPDGADAREADRLEREHRLAMRSRHLTFSNDHAGSLLFRGSLPAAEAEPFVRIIDAYAASARRGLDRLDPHAEHLTAAMWRADALLAMVHQHGEQSLAPSHGGDRPRVVVTVSYDTLRKAATDAGLIAGGLAGSSEPIAPGVLRRLLCDADVLPAVLGGRSEVLDVGRAQRLVTGPIRAALEVRDGGCVFPGCDAPPGPARPTTSFPGGRAARRHCTTSSSSVGTTTASSNPDATAPPTVGGCGSGATVWRRSFPRDASTRPAGHASPPAS